MGQTRRRFICLAFLVMVVLPAVAVAAESAAPAAGETPCLSGVPPLPPPTGAVVRVTNVAQLKAAMAALTTGQTVLIAPGTYAVDGTLSLPEGISDVVIRGQTGACADVTVQGTGMAAGGNTAPFGFRAVNVNGVAFSSMTIRDFRRHGIVLGAGVRSPRLHNLRIIDIGDQSLKSNPDGRGGGVDHGIVEYSIFEYTTQAPDDYTNGVDLHTSAGWVIRRNVFRNFRSAVGLAGPAVLIWNGSRDTIVEGNTFVNCHRSVSLGLVQRRGFTDHSGGIVRNNFVFRAADQRGDVGIHVADSPSTKVLHNTVLLSGTYPNAIETRFATTTGAEIRGNLTDGAIMARDRATGTMAGNAMNATAALFVNPDVGDLHLKSTASMALDRGTPHPDVRQDIDGDSRPQGSAPDLGADEFRSGPGAAAEAPVTAPAPSTGSSTLLQQGNLAYAGAFRVPAGKFGGSTFPYGGTALAYNPTHHSLFIVGHDWQQMVAEIKIPAIGKSADVAALATAKVLQPFVDATEGRMKSILTSPNESVKVGGLLVDNGKLLVSVYDYYDGCGCNAQTSHFVAGLTLSRTGNVQGPFKVGSLNPGFVAGYMTPIPAEWQAVLGGSAITGSCCLAVVGRTSFGPAAFAFNPADVGTVPTAPAVPLVYYPASHRTLGAWDATWNGSSILYNGTTVIRGAALPSGTRSLLFFGSQGTGPFCYGAGVETTPPGSNECFNPGNSGKGTHAYPYQYQVWAYDVLELAAVKAGKKRPWDVRPYAVWSLTFPSSPVNRSVQLGGVAYDPGARRLYVSQQFADLVGLDPLPVIHVFEVVP